MAITVQELPQVLSECLSEKNLRLQVNQSGNQISVVINRLTNQGNFDYERISEILLDKLRSLNLPNITAVKFYGRPANTKQIDWQITHSLVIEAVKPAVMATSNGHGALVQKSKTKFQSYLEQFSHYSNVISAASLLGLLLLLGFNTLAGQKTKEVAWEYKIETVPDLIFTETMNRHGNEGWDVVFARRAKDSETDSFAYECIFKRAKK